MKIDRRLIQNFDWVILASVIVLSLLGIMTIYSSTRPLPGSEQPSFYIKQFYWLLAGILALILMVTIDYSWLNRASVALFAAGLGLLVLVLVLGRTGMGATRWISIGPVGFQPSEFAKLAYILVLARYLSMRTGSLRAGNIGFAMAVFVFPPILLLLKQPDLGTSMVFLAIFALMALAKGVRKKVVAMSVAIFLISAPFVGTIVWDGLKDYQKKRITAFLKQSDDPEGENYHLTQSKVAVGSGGLFGKGYLKGTQGPFRFLPEKHTDFVFAVFAEEWGFAGSFLLLVAFLVVLLRGLHTAEKAKDEFGRLAALGITFMLSFYCFINISMTLGLMPVVGIPLPFMSYGGTALVSNFMAVGILINIKARRFELFY